MTTIKEFIQSFEKNVLNPFISLLFVLATVIFIFGVVQYVIAGGSQEKTQKAKLVMLWGIIGMTIMASAWGIVGILCKFFGTCNNILPCGAACS